MARQVLQATTDFFKSDYLPAMCLFSGRTDHIERHMLVLGIQPGNDQADSNLLALLVARVGLLIDVLERIIGSSRLLVPAAPGEFTSWRWRKRRVWLFVVAGVAAGAMWLQYSKGPWAPSSTMRYVALALIGVGMLLALFQYLSNVGSCVQIRLLDARGTLEIEFPDSREHIYWEYKDAFLRYMTLGGESERLPDAGTHARKQAEEDRWQDGVQPAWDPTSHEAVPIAAADPANLPAAPGRPPQAPDASAGPDV